MKKKIYLLIMALLLLISCKKEETDKKNVENVLLSPEVSTFTSPTQLITNDINAVSPTNIPTQSEAVINKSDSQPTEAPTKVLAKATATPKLTSKPKNSTPKPKPTTSPVKDVPTTTPTKAPPPTPKAVQTVPNTQPPTKEPTNSPTTPPTQSPTIIPTTQTELTYDVVTDAKKIADDLIDCSKQNGWYVVEEKELRNTYYQYGYYTFIKIDCSSDGESHTIFWMVRSELSGTPDIHADIQIRQMFPGNTDYYNFDNYILKIDVDSLKKTIVSYGNAE